MRIAKPAFIALAALALLATPVLAKSAKAQKADTESVDTPPPCFSYRLGADGNWVQQPCEEFGTHSSSQHRAPSKTHDQEAH
jgi:hypothetical protein